ncbi:MAG: hypothetical protein J6B95_01235 [Oscillospiraceae bacterium]|nr:hypothetical protein [Oscillospiraceae bacterium]
MNKDKVIDSLAGIDDDMIQTVEALRRKYRHPVRLKWGTFAACLFLVIALAIPTIFFHQPESPKETMAPGDGPPSLIVNGIDYYISSYLAVSDELPDGFELAGETSVGGFEECPYYTNPDMPEWIYVYHEVSTDGKVDATGTLNRTEPHNAYVRYVDARLRGKDLVCYNGEYYISMWSAADYGTYPDVNHEYYEKMENTYGIRTEGDAPAGFVSAGITEFSGYDTIPRGALVSNEGEYEVYVNPTDPDVVLVATKWHTAPVGEKGETNHSGFNVYIRYDCPIA